MSHPHLQAGSWAGIPEGGKRAFIGGKKKKTQIFWSHCPIAVLRGRKVFCLFDFRKLTSALGQFFNALYWFGILSKLEFSYVSILK